MNCFILFYYHFKNCLYYFSFSIEHKEEKHSCDRKKYFLPKLKYVTNMEILIYYHLKNDHVLDFAFRKEHAKMRCVVSFLQFFRRSTAQTLKKSLCKSFRVYQSVLNICV